MSLRAKSMSKGIGAKELCHFLSKDGELIKLDEQVHCHSGKKFPYLAHIGPDNSAITSMMCC